ncbi:hypothetical protein F5141DRAFT_1067233 [Pisolithus sp. B1]|nr:hypothetical protein F5141DRAFT_1067233 [Pisolithus sp. B1]
MTGCRPASAAESLRDFGASVDYTQCRPVSRWYPRPAYSLRCYPGYITIFPFGILRRSIPGIGSCDLHAGSVGTSASLGSNWVLLCATAVGPLVGGESMDNMDRGLDMEDDTDDTVEPTLLFAGEEGRDP